MTMLGIASGAFARNASAGQPGTALRAVTYATIIASAVPTVAAPSDRIIVFHNATGVASSSKKTKWKCAAVSVAKVGKAGAILTIAASSSAPYGNTIDMMRMTPQKANAIHFHGPSALIVRRAP